MQIVDLNECLKSKQGYCYSDGLDCLYGKTKPLDDCTMVAGVNLTFDFCQSISDDRCSVNADQTSCVEKQDTCNLYSQGSCFQATTDGDCIWTGTTCKQKSSIICDDFDNATCTTTNLLCKFENGKCIFDCSKNPDPINQDTCEANNDTCTALFDGTGCKAMVSDCASTEKSSCTKSKAGYCYWDGTNCIDASKDPLTICSIILGVNLTFTYCQSISNNLCSVNQAQNTCIDKEDTCSKYSQLNCFWAVNDGECKWFSNSCQKKPTNKCSDLNGSSINDCTEQSQTCTQTSGGKCSVDCTNKSGITNHDICQAYDLECTSKLDGSSCVKISDTCSNIKIEDCIYAIDQFCYVQNSACKTASSAPLVTCSTVKGNKLTYSYCQSISNNKCSVNSNKDACIQQQDMCSDYQNPTDCYWAATENECFWTVNSKCKEKSIAECGDFNTEEPCSQNFCTFSYGTCSLACENKTTNMDQDKCESYNLQCTSKLDGSGCTYVMETCAAYTGANLKNCTKSKEGYCYNEESICKSAKATPLTTCTNVNGGTNLTFNYCQQISNKACSVNAAKTSCIVKQDNCNTYSKDDCYYALIDKECIWTDFNNCKQISQVQCSDFSGTNDDNCNSKRKSCKLKTGTSTCTFDCSTISESVNHDKCQSYDLSCTSKLDGTGCVSIKHDCASVTLKNECIYSEEGFCYYSSCVSAAPPINDCSKITGTNLTPQYCKGQWNMHSQNGSKQIKDKCSDYSSTLDCLYSSKNEPLCIVNSSNNGCIAFDDKCSSIKIHSITEYNNYYCQLFKVTCQTKSDKSGCEDIIIIPADLKIPVTPLPPDQTSTQQPELTCSQFTGVNLNYYYCIDQLNTCSVNQAKTACVTAQNNCTNYSIENCGYSLNEGECIVEGNACIQNNCQSSSPTALTNDLCQQTSTNCVSTGGCMKRNSCNVFLIMENCIKDMNGNDCLWNVITQKCVDKICELAESTINYDSHETVKVNGINVGQGCIQRVPCINYTIKEQCIVSDLGVVCDWNNDHTPYCQEKSCSSAPYKYRSHEECNKYIAGCTVNAIKQNESYILQGCTTLKQCSEYMAEEQCIMSTTIINKKNLQCGWLNGICQNRSCQTAPSHLISSMLCQEYLSGCTVSQSNSGCVVIPNNCEEMTVQQCHSESVDINNKRCFWVDDQTGCITRTCENSPQYSNDNDCNSYLEGCTIDLTQQCKVKVCEDYKFTTDSDCDQVQPKGTCTSNGSFCITRKDCLDAKTEFGCVKDYLGRPCQWMSEYNAYCTLKNCTTAPQTLITEDDCFKYYSPIDGATCTIKAGGGCKTKGTCAEANVEAACITDKAGKKCSWDESIQSCRDQECIDLYGSTHYLCNKTRSDCTAGLKGKCAKMQECQATTLKQACIQGLDGPCLWINETNNCYRYDACESLSWKTDTECKQISQNCTTDGTKCVGITLCSETNTNGGCKTGTDGQCIQLKNEKETICKKFDNCNEAAYLTHDECQTANSSCTSDYKDGCVDLEKCKSYKIKDQCIIYKQGMVKNYLGEITSTGQCVWNSNNSCKDVECSDLNLTECGVKLSNCIIDGTKCVIKDNCASYTKQACNQTCIWVESKCRVKECTDVEGKTSAACSVFSNCVSNGTKCIVKSACQKYATKIACLSTGTDGICYWSQGSCALMQECNQAKEEDQCKQVNDRCYWGSNACKTHTCETYKQQTNQCSYFPDWNQAKINICSIQQDKCISSEADLLSQSDCYMQTAYLYSWNQNQFKCVSCQIISHIENLTTETQVTLFEELLKTVVIFYLIN